MPDSAPRILLTGAGGMIGSQVLAHLPADAEVYCISRAARDAQAVAGGRRWIAADLRDPAACRDLVAGLRPTHLVHAAWTTEHGVFWSAEDNEAWLHAGVALVEAFGQTGGQRLVVCGTCAEYEGESDLPRREADTGSEPATLYGRSKLQFFHGIEDLARRYGFSAAWARIFNVYGIGEKPARFVPQTIAKLLAGQPAPCNSGNFVRDFIDVRDLGRALAALAFSHIDGPVNLGSGETASLGQVATLLGAITNRPDLVRIGESPAHAREPETLVPDLSRMRRELGFVPTYGLAPGLADAVAWWRPRLLDDVGAQPPVPASASGISGRGVSALAR